MSPLQVSIKNLYNVINALYRCNKNDYFVKLIVGKPSQTFLVPATHIRFGWQNSDFMQTVTNTDTNLASRKLEPGSPRSDRMENSRRLSITESLASVKRWFVWSSESKLLNAGSKRPSSESEPLPREIKLPDDHPMAWSTFLYWSMHPGSEFIEADKSKDISLVHSWNLGSKYGFGNFSDDVMIHLVQYFDKFEASGTVKQSITADAIRVTYCSGPLGGSVLKTLIAQEIAKSKLFNKCEFRGDPHNPTGCHHCARDRAEIKELLKCIWPPGKKHAGHACGLGTDLWTELVKAKRMYRDPNHRKDLFKRLSKPKGKAPVYMEFLTSTKWVEVRSMLNKKV